MGLATMKSVILHLSGGSAGVQEEWGGHGAREDTKTGCREWDRAWREVSKHVDIGMGKQGAVS